MRTESANQPARLLAARPKKRQVAAEPRKAHSGWRKGTCPGVRTCNHGVACERAWRRVKHDELRRVPLSLFG